MRKTPNSNRIHIAVFGKRNAGKSSIINALTGQKVSLVSNIKGTTTDPVYKAMELIPLGPVLFIDTAGLDDEGDLGQLRVKKTTRVYQKTDFALYIMDINDIDYEVYQEAQRNFKRFNIKHLLVINKADTANDQQILEIKEKYENSIFVSASQLVNIDNLRESVVNCLSTEIEEDVIVGDLLPYDSTVVMVVPIDSEAPKGRIILPQVQLIRDCLDHGIKSYVVRDTELEGALTDLKKVDLVVTDSQAFKEVDKIVPNDILLTSFSILFARHKGDFNILLHGTKAIDQLKENSRILIVETCSHNQTHEDIGRVKIPNLLKKRTGKKLNFEFAMGVDLPSDLGSYNLVIHCGACMSNKKTMQSRMLMCQEAGVPITNYGMTLAMINGILERATEVFN